MSRGASKYTMFAAAIMAVLVMIIVQGTVPAQARLSAADCKAERHEIVNACKPVLYGMTPNAKCCKWIRNAHLEKCVCPVITPKLAALVNVNRMVRLVQNCGRRVPHHFKCGSKSNQSVHRSSLLV